MKVFTVNLPQDGKPCVLKRVWVNGWAYRLRDLVTPKCPDIYGTPNGCAYGSVWALDAREVRKRVEGSPIAGLTDGEIVDLQVQIGLKLKARAAEVCL
jgi:hypothetical protein